MITALLIYFGLVSASPTPDPEPESGSNGPPPVEELLVGR